ncbi:hypothetical protein [Salipiger bermudensis]|uniref:hypothetical protein n=1 Tax=Salipiger bermudensis TaxID=344736 RepID=UPI0030092BEB
MTEKRRYCPTDVFVEARTALMKRLDQAVNELSIPRLSLAFFDKSGQFDYNRVLHTDPDLKFMKASIYEGLLGLTIRRGEIVIYPHSVDSKEAFLKVDPRTTFEIAGPILFQNTACAALFGDLFDEDDSEPPDYEVLRTQFRKVLASLTDIVEESRKSVLEKIVRDKLEHLISETSSVRGYVAIKDWDSSLTTIETGDDTDVFIDLSENEGVCGYVLQTGLEINIKNTRTPPTLIHRGEPRFYYISSDSRVKSEFVCPFQFDGTVLGILNLEAHHENNYRKHRRDLILTCRDELLQSVQEYREPLDVNLIGPEFVLGRAMQDLSGAFRPHQSRSYTKILSEVSDGLYQEIKQLFPRARLHGPYTSAQSLGAEFSQHVLWDDRHFVDQWEEDGAWFFGCEIRRDGLRQSLIIVEEDSMFSQSASGSLRRLSRLSALRLSNYISVNSQGAKDTMVSMLVLGSFEDFISSAPELCCALWNCDNTTIFKAVDVGDEKVRLFPVSSTTDQLDYLDSERYYTVGNNDGLTGYAATKKKPYVISHFTDSDSLKSLGVFSGLKAKIVEVRNNEPQSFAAIQLIKGSKIEYLIRLSKILGNRSAGFSEEDYDAMVLIQSLYNLR